MKLTREEIDIGFNAIEHHGFSTLFPHPPEWSDLVDHYDEIATWVSNQDLFSYTPSVPLRVFAPKNRFGVRAVTHLHPVDLLIYTSMVMILRQDIETNRLPRSQKRVFSFRRKTADQTLYEVGDDYQEYTKQLRARASLVSKKFVAIADIADFYPRIYQHRLENALTAAASNTRNEQVAKVLVAKFLPKLSNGVSYGIPVGPYASRPLAEALLIDTDIALTNLGFDFVRWVDDITFFCRSESEAQHGIFSLAKWLWDEHGLTLQSSKTKIVSAEFFLEEVLIRPEDRLKIASEFLRTFWVLSSKYDDDGDEPDMSEEDAQELEAFSFEGLLDEALADPANVDYETISFILGKVVRLKEFSDDKRRELLETVLANVEHLYPVSSSLAEFFLSFSHLAKAEKTRIGKRLLKPILKSSPPPPDYYVMWVLSIFGSDESWNNADKICQLFIESQSETVMRYAALSLEKTGQRSHALQIRERFDSASPLLKLAILRASRRLGGDERKFWKRGKTLTLPLEKRV